MAEIFDFEAAQRDRDRRTGKTGAATLDPDKLEYLRHLHGIAVSMRTGQEAMAARDTAEAQKQRAAQNEHAQFYAWMRQLPGRAP